MSKNPQWISEASAAALIGYKPITLRRYAKYGKLHIDYYTIRGRLYFYDKNDIEKIIQEHSTLTK